MIDKSEAVTLWRERNLEEGGQHPFELYQFAKVRSSFYPMLETWYEERSLDWLEGTLESYSLEAELLALRVLRKLAAIPSHAQIKMVLDMAKASCL